MYKREITIMFSTIKQKRNPMWSLFGHSGGGYGSLPSKISC